MDIKLETFNDSVMQIEGGDSLKTDELDTPPPTSNCFVFQLLWLLWPGLFLFVLIEEMDALK